MNQSATIYSASVALLDAGADMNCQFKDKDARDRFTTMAEAFMRDLFPDATRIDVLHSTRINEWDE